MKSKSIVRESLLDGQNIRKMAEAAAKKKIIEDLTPSIRTLVESQINNVMDASEDTDRLRRHHDGRGETAFEEGKDALAEGDDDMPKDEKDLDEAGLGLEAMFPHLAEMEDEDEEGLELPKAPEGEEELDVEGLGLAYEIGGQGEEEMEMPAEMSIPTLGEGEEGDMEDMDEEISIDENELKKAYESIMKTNAALSEAQVSSGFADSYPKSEWETEDSPPSDTGLMDKDGDKPWDEGRAGAAQDYQVKEAIEKGLKENSALRGYVAHLEEQLSAAHTVVSRLKEEVSNVNLVNMKVLRVNEMLNKFGKSLTVEQKKVVVEKIDSAKTVREVKMVAEALNASFGTVGTITESKRRPKANAQRRRTSGSPNQKVLRESVSKGGNPQYSRLRELAGLIS